MINQGSAPHSRREDILAKVQEIESIPTAAAKTLQLLQDPDIGAAELARAIEIDPGLTANILRMANSAVFGTGRSISSVRDATVRLGRKRLRDLVSSAIAGPLVKQPVSGYDLPAGGLWQHSVGVAVAAEELAKVLDRSAPACTFTAGLLHDIGKVILGTFVGVDAAPIQELAFQEEVSFEEAERRVLGIDHCEVGAVLLGHWGLPEEIMTAVSWHHRPDDSPGEAFLVDLIHAADNICMMSGIGSGQDGLNYIPSAGAVNRLGLTTQAMEMTVCRMLGVLGEMGDIFQQESCAAPDA